jgi:hypothetical protein
MRWLALALVLAAVPARAEDETVLPPGEGRAEVFGLCTACHDTAVIRRSRLTRQQWDGLMDWMSERHGMAQLDDGLRSSVVDYLARSFGPAAAPGGRGRNPFLQ